MNMKFDLIQACKLCPFRKGEGRITFACRERAEEIDEIAYREGFVCHEHSEHIEGDGEESGYFTFRDDGSSQHCFGALAMYLRNGDSTVVWEGATERDGKLEEYWWDRVRDKTFAEIFESPEAFLEANE